MELEQIMKLIDAGYSKAEIDKIIGAGEPAPAPEPKSAPTPAPDLQPAPAQDPNAALLAEIKTLNATIAAMQAQAAKNATGGAPEHKTASDAIREFFGKPAEGSK
jgi:hypothetical protein